MIRSRITLARTAWGLGAIAVLLLAPAMAQACPVCMGGAEEDVRKAFIITTIVLSASPLLMVGGLVWWLRRTFRAAEGEEEGAALPAGASLPPATGSLSS